MSNKILGFALGIFTLATLSAMDSSAQQKKMHHGPHKVVKVHPHPHKAHKAHKHAKSRAHVHHPQPKTIAQIKAEERYHKRAIKAHKRALKHKKAMARHAHFGY